MLRCRQCLGVNERVADRDIHSLTGNAASPPRNVGKETGRGRVRKPLSRNQKLVSEIARLSELADERAKQCALLQTLVDAVPDYLWVKDVDGPFVAANMALATDSGRAKAADMIGLTDFDIHPRDKAQEFHIAEQEVIHSGRAETGLESVESVDGLKRWFSTTKSPLRNERGEVVGVVGIGRDVTETKLAQDRTRFVADHDALTGFPNRALLMDRLNQSILFAQRYGRWLTVVFVDLDNFKLVNNTLGRDAGDQLLKTVAGRIRDCLKETDTVVRLGADEFAVLLTDLPGNMDVTMATLQELSTRVCQPARVNGHLLQVSSSIGLANYPNDGTDGEALLANAEAAMQRAKEMGRDNFQFYTPALNARVHERFQLQEELRNAIAREEFFLLFQPQVDLRTGRIVAVEALIRWNHPSGGVVYPIDLFRLLRNRGSSGRLATGRCVPRADRTRRGRMPGTFRSTSASMFPRANSARRIGFAGLSKRFRRADSKRNISNSNSPKASSCRMSIRRSAR